MYSENPVSSTQRRAMWYLSNCDLTNQKRVFLKCPVVKMLQGLFGVDPFQHTGVLLCCIANIGSTKQNSNPKCMEDTTTWYSPTTQNKKNYLR
mmetsp:Transcript_62596/g.100903  ORF Transcript_62596/g.100903 Transcript_62596/m.100903 type:complete len:93 (+) Transcript_62596:1169-1447(+)